MGNMDLKRKASVKKAVILVTALAFLAACHSNSDYSPKPRGYSRLYFPQRAYRTFDTIYPFTFVYPKYAYIEKDVRPQASDKLLNMKYLLNMQFPGFNGTLHLSYE